MILKQFVYYDSPHKWMQLLWILKQIYTTTLSTKLPITLLVLVQEFNQKTFPKNSLTLEWWNESAKMLTYFQVLAYKNV